MGIWGDEEMQWDSYASGMLGYDMIMRGNAFFILHMKTLMRTSLLDIPALTNI